MSRSGKSASLCCTAFMMLFLVLMSATSQTFALGDPSLPVKTVSLLSDGSSEVLTDLTLRFKKALVALAEGEATLIFKEKSDGSAGWQRKRAATLLRSVSEDPGADLILINGPLLAAEAATLKAPQAKPIVGFFQFDPAFILPKIMTDKPSLSLTVIPGQMESDFKSMSQLFKAGPLAVLVDSVLLHQIEDLKDHLVVAAKAHGFDAVVQPIQDTADATLSSLNEGVKVVYLTSEIRMPGHERKELIRQLNEQGMFVFSAVGAEDVQQGALAGQLPAMSERLARHAALNAMRLLSGVRTRAPLDPLSPRRRLMINEETAGAVRYRVAEKLAKEAEELETGPEQKTVVNALPEVDRLPFEHHLKRTAAPELTLAQAVERAIQQNARLSAKQAEVEEDQQDRDRALTELFPQIKGQVGYQRVDENTALRSFEAIPLQRSSASVALKQLIFSDPVITNLRAANKNVESELFKEASERLDVAERVQKHYIDCLSAAALYWIREYNLNLTRQNLDTARQRNATGTAGPQEVYRWEAQEAQDRSQLLAAQSDLQLAMVGLNRIMGENQRQIWSFKDVRGIRLKGTFNAQTFGSLIQDSHDFSALNAFVVDKALDSSPELKSIDSLIDATRIVRGYLKRRFYTPEASVEFGYSHTLDQTYDNPDSSFNIDDYVPGDSENHWSVGVKLVWSLFEGGGKVVDMRKNQATLKRLESLHRDASQIVEQRARDALIQASTARTDMDLAKTAATAAEKNYKVTRDGYAQGVSTILDLLDAQREAAVQERKVILSEYRFLKAVVAVERAMNRIAALVTEEEQEAGWQELRARMGRSN